MSDFEIRQVDVQELARAWWLVVLVGIISLIAGIIVLAQPSNSLATLAVIVGIFMLVDGIVELVRSLAGAVESRTLGVILGLLGIIIGIILIRHPFNAVAAIGLLIGLWLVAAGVIRLVSAVAQGPHRPIRLLIAAIEIIVGIVIVSDPHIGYTALAVIAGISLIINGAAYTALGLAMRRGKSGLSGPRPRPA